MARESDKGSRPLGQPLTTPRPDFLLRAHSETTLHTDMEKRTKPAFTQPGGGHGKSSGCTVAKKWGPRGDGSPQEAGARCSHATPPPRHNIKVTRAFLGQSPGDLGGEPEVSKLAGLKKRKKKPQNYTHRVSGQHWGQQVKRGP